MLPLEFSPPTSAGAWVPAAERACNLSRHDGLVRLNPGLPGDAPQPRDEAYLLLPA